MKQNRQSYHALCMHVQFFGFQEGFLLANLHRYGDKPTYTMFWINPLAKFIKIKLYSVKWIIFIIENNNFNAKLKTECRNKKDNNYNIY